MYFIVYILQTSQHIVVPHSWLNLTQFLEAIVNNGINTNVISEVFYTRNANAFRNGVPRLDFAPDWPEYRYFGPENQIPNEGWYKCYIRRFKRMCYFLDYFNNAT